MKLVDIPVVFICPSHNEKYLAREKHMHELLQAIGFKSITHYKSGCEAYPSCLVNATVDILNKHMNDEPVIILEDDIEMYRDLNSETLIDMPDDCDAFYLGFSKSGGSKTRNSHEGPSIVRHISDTHIRILNMLCTHAIIYVSQRYKERVIKELNTIKEHVGYFNDVVIARLHPEYKIYGYHYPLFYQSVKWGNVQHTENYTRYHYDIFFGHVQL
jgi:hypothetical protein